MTPSPSKYARVRRAGAIVLCLAGYALVLTFPNDVTLSLSISTSRLLLAGGIIAATLGTWVVQYTFHVPMTRRALFPWGAIGGAGAVLLFAAQTNSLGDHPAFMLTAIGRSVLLCLSIRLTIDLVLGAMDGTIAWGSTITEEPVAQQTVPDEALTMPAEALRPAWMTELERAVAHEHAELKLVSEKEDREHNPSAPPRHKRTSG